MRRRPGTRHGAPGTSASASAVLQGALTQPLLRRAGATVLRPLLPRDPAAGPFLPASQGLPPLPPRFPECYRPHPCHACAAHAEADHRDAAALVPRHWLCHAAAWRCGTTDCAHRFSYPLFVPLSGSPGSPGAAALPVAITLHTGVAVATIMAVL